jgi:putative phage-type endonuclease
MMEQRTEEWYAARLGKVTASRVADIVAKTKTGYSTSRANYMAELICERLTGVRGDFYMNAAMQWGVEKEPEARAVYEAQTGALVTEVGFTPHNLIESAGASPDGLVGNDGLAEFKCPITATHLDTILTETIPGRYATQMQWQMACTGRQWCDFVSYDPRLPEELRLFVKRVPRDEAVVSMLEREVQSFLSELNDKLAKLKEKFNGI